MDFTDQGQRNVTGLIDDGVIGIEIVFAEDMDIDLFPGLQLDLGANRIGLRHSHRVIRGLTAGEIGV